MGGVERGEGTRCRQCRQSQVARAAPVHHTRLKKEGGEVEAVGERERERERKRERDDFSCDWLCL